MQRAAVARGRGDQLQAVEVPAVHLVLANPGVAVSAADAYRWLAQQGTYGPVLDIPAVLEALAQRQPPPWHNTLQAGVVRQYPVIAQVLEALQAAGLQATLLSGSGATCFGLAPSQAAAQQAALWLRQRTTWWVQAAQVVPQLASRG